MNPPWWDKLTKAQQERIDFVARRTFEEEHDGILTFEKIEERFGVLEAQTAIWRARHTAKVHIAVFDACKESWRIQQAADAGGSPFADRAHRDEASAVGRTHRLSPDTGTTDIKV